MTLTSSTLESAVTAAVSDLLFAIDDLDWEGVRNALADEVTIDYTSLWGGEPEHLAASELVARWQGLLPGFDATQHLTGPIVVRQAGEGRVTATTTVRGYHVVETAGEPTIWMVAGRYLLTLEQGADGDWKISGVTLRVAYQEGDRGLPDVAKSRAASGSGGRAA